MVNYWFREFRRLIWIVLGFSLIGWFVGHFWFCFSAGLLGYVVWTFWQIWRIRDWLLNPERKQVPQSFGLWGEINDSIYSLYKAQLRERERLKQTVRYLHDSFASLNDAVVMVNSAGSIDWCNQAAEKFLGLKHPQDQNQQLVNFLRAPEFLEYYEAADFAKPLQMQSPANSQFTLQFHITRFGLGNLLIFARNITDLKNNEQMRKDFLANVSHELRTPLTVISGYLDNMSMAPAISDDKMLSLAARQMRSQASRMEALIKDLTDLSRLESRPLLAEPQEILLAKLLKEIQATALATATDEQQVLLECSDNVLLLGDYKELHSVFSNLVENALKYSGKQGRVQVRVTHKDQTLIVSIADNGQGIEAHHIPRLTERFYRVDSSRSLDTGGTGLGLAIVKHALHRHEAQLEISSELGVGSDFICEFPAQRFKIA